LEFRVQLESISDGSSDYSYTYDDAGRILSIDNDGTDGVAHVVLSQTYASATALRSPPVSLARRSSPTPINMTRWAK
jgi:hypothetical protein